MSFRFRIGPFTFGRTGVRLSLWKRGSGVSIPLTGKKNRSFGKVRAGPFSWYLNPKSKKQAVPQKASIPNAGIESCEAWAIQDFASDKSFLKRLQRQGLPWRGVQERLKEGLPEDLADRDNIAFHLVPKAMDEVFGQQNTAWKTEKRPSKSGSGSTTWIVLN